MPAGPKNPFDIGFYHTETELLTEKAAVRDIDTTKSRVWKIKNPKVTNPRTGMISPHKYHTNLHCCALPSSREILWWTLYIAIALLTSYATNSEIKLHDMHCM